jgi:hypothetical protein
MEAKIAVSWLREIYKNLLIQRNLARIPGPEPQNIAQLQILADSVSLLFP